MNFVQIILCKDFMMKNEKVSKIVTVTAIERPARKLIILRAKNTKDGDYEAYWEEMNCDWEDYLNSISEKFAPVALLTLPDNLVKPDTSNTASGVEVPFDYSLAVKEGYEIIDLPPCTMLYFQGASYENGEDFNIAIDIVMQALENYDPNRYGFIYTPELAPKFNYGANEKMGALIAVPVQESDKPCY